MTNASSPPNAIRLETASTSSIRCIVSLSETTRFSLNAHIINPLENLHLCHDRVSYSHAIGPKDGSLDAATVKDQIFGMIIRLASETLEGIWNNSKL